MWKVIVDIYPKTIKGTKGCHKYVFDKYKTKMEATQITDEINKLNTLGKAHFEKAQSDTFRHCNAGAFEVEI